MKATFAGASGDEQDPKYALRLLVDIAIRALFPAINDPKPRCRPLIRSRISCCVADADGWRSAFSVIRCCGATSVQIMRRMKALAADLIRALPQERHESLRHYQHRLDATIASSFEDAEEKRKASIEDRRGLGIPRA